MEKYFGTDGIRGPFGTAPIDELHLNRLAQAVGKRYTPQHLMIGRDTRASGVEIKRFLINGFPSDTEIFDGGIVTSPLLSLAIIEAGAELGIMITASHNPATDNGVKIFNRFGKKITVEEEEDLKQRMNDLPGPIENRGHHIIPYPIQAHYKMAPENPLPHVVIDCANGAAVEFAKASYHFPKIDWLGDQPDGRNINANCGSEHPELLCQTVRENGAHLGIAHDGDGDRLLLCDRFGKILPGEVVLGTIAIFLEKTGQLHGHQIVTTAMSNGGLRLSLEQYGIGVINAKVGDRHIAAMMHKFGSNLGGEHSGHIIFSDGTPSSDGIQAALLFLKAIEFLNLSPENTRPLISFLPQKLCNIPVKRKFPLEDLPGWSALIEKEHEKIGKNGKIFVRYSGTEPKLRLLVEAETEDKVENVLNALKNYIENREEIL
ncbi:MAG: hypothetical protein LBB05_01305 [Puniceicoccales bacterium]|jgi:phosphoglucosamine mutase|nr:hypothetical protein [Puniceicoccales bacterium]